jgi:hypothetical protein
MILLALRLKINTTIVVSAQKIMACMESSGPNALPVINSGPWILASNKLFVFSFREVIAPKIPDWVKFQQNVKQVAFYKSKKTFFFNSVRATFSAYFVRDYSLMKIFCNY